MLNSIPSSEGIAAAYKYWLLTLARQEAATGCPRLFSFKGALPMYVAELTASWASEDRLHLMRACIKRHYFPNMDPSGTALTPEEEVAYDQLEWPLSCNWRKAGRPSAIHVSRMTGIGFEVDAIKLAEVRRMEASSLGEYKLDRKRLRREIGAAMKAAFGEPVREAGGTWAYWTPIAGITVQTVVDFGVRQPTQFRYSQALFELRPTGDVAERIQMVPGICELVGYPQDDWKYVTEPDVPATARLLARLCKESVDAVPEILEAARAIDQARLH